MAVTRNDRPVRPVETAETSGDVQAFLRKVAAAPAPATGGSRGRLMFAMDATASRQPAWDRACHIQSEMFHSTSAIGGLDVQLVLYRGYGECKASPWVSDAATLARKMTGVSCLGGRTQIGRVLAHAAKECRAKRVNALVFVGDAFEEEIDAVCAQAGELGLLGMPAFMFHEGPDPVARNAFEQIARLSGGACCSFDGSSADQLKALLAAVAVFAAGGMKALEDYGHRAGGEAARLSGQLRALPGRR